jgi:hypothetical protein
VVVSDALNNRLQFLTSEKGAYIRDFGETGKAPGQFSKPQGIAISTVDVGSGASQSSNASRALLGVADYNNDRVQILALSACSKEGTGSGSKAATVSVSVMSIIDCGQCGFRRPLDVAFLPSVSIDGGQTNASTSAPRIAVCAQGFSEICFFSFKTSDNNTSSTSPSPGTGTLLRKIGFDLSPSVTPTDFILNTSQMQVYSLNAMPCPHWMWCSTSASALGSSTSTSTATEIETAAADTQLAQQGQLVLYKHTDGSQERVRIVVDHSDVEGDGVTIFIPSLCRERQTTRDRISIHSSSSSANGGGNDSGDSGNDRLMEACLSQHLLVGAGKKIAAGNRYFYS